MAYKINDSVMKSVIFEAAHRPGVCVISLAENKFYIANSPELTQLFSLHPI